MKRIIYVSLVVSLLGLLSACDNFLDVRPKSEKVENEQFESAQGFEDAIYGTYGELQKGNSYGMCLLWGINEILSQHLAVSGTNVFSNALEEYDYANSEVKNTLANVWSDMYKTIGYINNVLKNLEGREDMPLYDMYKGEMLGLRAFLHFDLLRLFASTDMNSQGIPYVESYSYSVKPFLKVDEVYAKIIKDLLTAEELLAEKENLAYPRSDYNNNSFLNFRTTHFNLHAVRATLARVYWMKGDMANAGLYASKVIDSELFPLVDPTEVASYLAGKLSEKETIFGVYSSSYIETAKNRLYTQTTGSTYNAYTNSSGTDYLLTYDKIYQTDNDNTNTDFRISHFSASRWTKLVDYYTLANQGVPSGWDNRTDGITLIHVSEMYLIAAEAFLESNYNLAIKLFDLELASRGLKGFKSQDKILSKDNIFNEYRKEMFGEGQVWYNMKRLNKDIECNKLGRILTASDSYYVFPIPDAELEYRPTEE